MKKRFFLFALLISSCTQYTAKENTFSSIQIVDRKGIIEAIGQKERLKAFEKMDFLSPQPYQKVTRFFEKNDSGHTKAIITSYHKNGQPWQYLETVDARAKGSYQEWHENGQLKIKATVLEGPGDIDLSSQKNWLFDDVSYVWDETGNLLAKFFYAKGKLDGKAIYYYPNKVVKKTAQYSQNQLHGEVAEFFPNGHLYSKSYFEKDIQHGICLAYWENDKPFSIETFEKGKILHAFYYDETGKVLCKIQKGKGFKAKKMDDSSLQYIQYQEGVAQGEVQIFNSQNQLISSYHIKNGKKNGTEVIYFPSNSKEKIMHYTIDWKDNSIHGMVKTWYKNGFLESQKQMFRNKKNGTFCSWYEDGSLMMVEEYEKDSLVKGKYYKKGVDIPISQIRDGSGSAIFYDQEGVFLGKVSYKNGLPIGEK